MQTLHRVREQLRRERAQMQESPSARSTRSFVEAGSPEVMAEAKRAKVGLDGLLPKVEEKRACDADQVNTKKQESDQ